MSAALLLFAKTPVPGRVKTRLAASIGPELAARAYAVFLESTRAACERALGFQERYLFVAGDLGHEAIDRFRRSGWRIAPQPGGPLGERLEAGADQARAEGADRLVLIGSDAPTLSGAQIGAGLEALERAEVVLGPSFDGGYYLLAARVLTAPLFAGVPWSTPGVLRATLERAQRAGYSTALIEHWYDIDTLQDARYALDHLEAYLAPLRGGGYSELALILRKVVASSGRATP